MKLSYNWLKQFVDIKSTPEELGDKLTMLGFEIEHIERMGEGLETVVVGEIKKIDKHPDADKLQVTQTDVGKQNGGELTIVCGAPNIEVGQKVPVALVGTNLEMNGEKFEIKKSKIRGVESNGMLCAQDELGIGEDHTGIMILDLGIEVGTRLQDALGLDDVVYDLDVPANRGDVWSHLGMAREVAAVEGGELKDKFFIYDNTSIPLGDLTKKYKQNSKIKDFLEVEVKDQELCPKYTTKIVRNIKIKPSPQRIQRFLLACGVRPINNIVDITNAVMLAFGQPLHAFDLANLDDGKIVVRRAKKGEKMETLDEVERELDESMLLITDGKQPTAIAGIMGGQNSGINDKTVDVVIESAQFNYASVRKTSQRLGLRSESSARFERQVDWNVTELALEVAAKMMEELADGEVVDETVYIANKNAYQAKEIELKNDLVNRILGSDFDQKDIIKNLEAFGFEIAKKSKDTIKVLVPSWRNDIKLPIDLVEEVGRLEDFNSLGQTLPEFGIQPAEKNESLELDWKLRNLLVGLGFDEVLNYSFNGEVTKLDRLEVVNPVNPDQKYMRRSLMTRLSKNIEDNLKNFDRVQVFEIGHVYIPSDDELPVEDKILGIGISALKDPHASFDYIKGILEGIFEALKINTRNYIKTSDGVEVKLGKFDLAKIAYDKNQHILAEINLETLLMIMPKKRKYKTISNYPAVERDLSVIVDDHVEYAKLEKIILGADKLISSIELFDLFEDENKLGKGKKALAWHLEFSSSEKTLTMDEVEMIFGKIVEKLEQEVGAKLRGN